MAEPAYDLERFAPAKQIPARPRVRVARGEKEAKTARRQQVMRMVRTMLGVAVMVALVCGVLYTQTQLAELSKNITSAKNELNEEKSLNAYLTFEMDNMTSQKNIEERAAALGLEKMDNGQVYYFRVEEGNGIQVRENPFARMLTNLQSGIAGL
ncbi:hypothetical protein LJC60_04675, partial [Ruminococcaceae bacterium OttesenSCG-928-D13]|nr:hypothetical protein [Ruminococcaceae bacterium OttesenSCG-928-D13]